MKASKIAVVTGAASGIGRAVAEALVQRGHRVAATDLHLENLQKVARDADWPQAQVLLQALDVRDAEGWQKTMDDVEDLWGQVDLLFNIAGYLHPGNTHESSEEEVHRHIDINLKGTIFGIQAAARQMVKQGQGHIVNMASMAGLSPVPGLGLYAASKFGVRGYSLSAGYELKNLGVAVTLVCPDAVQTPMLDKQVDFDEAALTFSGSRALTTQDIVDALFNKVLPKKPLEIMLPNSRGAIAKFASAFPGVAPIVEPLLTRKGKKAQARAKKKRGSL